MANDHIRVVVYIQCTCIRKLKDHGLLLILSVLSTLSVFVFQPVSLKTLCSQTVYPQHDGHAGIHMYMYMYMYMYLGARHCTCTCR